MTKYSLFPSGSGFCFGDEIKDTRNETFYSKEKGAEILNSMFFTRKISTENAIALLKELITLAYLPIVERVIGDFDYLEEDFEALTGIKMLRDTLKMRKEMEESKVLKAVLCKSYKGDDKCGRIIGPTVFSTLFYSKDLGRVLLEKMKDGPFIEYSDYLRVQKEIDALDIPETTLNPADN